MPRLLNFIVAIYLIFVGLVGLGLLSWLTSVARESRVSRLARNPSKWCKARIFLSSFRIVESHGQSRREVQENRSEIKAICAGPQGRASAAARKAMKKSRGQAGRQSRQKRRQAGRESALQQAPCRPEASR